MSDLSIEFMGMSKNKKYTGHLNDLNSTNIYLNINNLKPGFYTLRITYKNKIIKEVKFKK